MLVTICKSVAMVGGVLLNLAVWLPLGYVAIGLIGVIAG